MAEASDHWHDAGIILGWNPTLWDEWPGGFAGVVASVADGEPYVTQWSVRSRKAVDPGTDASSRGRP